MYYTTEVDNNWKEDIKERGYMIRKKRISTCEFNIKLNLSKKSN